MTITLFSLGKVEALAQSLAQRITTRYPPVIANTPEPVVSRERVEEILESILSGEFETGGRLGVVVRAMLGYALKRRLREIGYDNEFVDFAVRRLGQRLTRPDA
jgi:hypothetical protein